MMFSNCENCGAPRVNSYCGYCGTDALVKIEKLDWGVASTTENIKGIIRMTGGTSDQEDGIQ